MTRTRVLGATLIGILLLMPAGSVVAQTPEPMPRTPETEERAAALAGLFPATLRGVSLLDSPEVDGFLAAHEIRGSDARQTIPAFVTAFQNDVPEVVAEQGKSATAK